MRTTNSMASNFIFALILLMAINLCLAKNNFPFSKMKDLDNVLFPSNVLFDRGVRSKLECVTSCSQTSGCFFLTFYGGNRCRGHSGVETSPAAGTATPGARTYMAADWQNVPCTTVSDCPTLVDNVQCYQGQCQCQVFNRYTANNRSCTEFVNGNWGTWGSWGTCSVTCGGGSQFRTRLCDNPAPANGGANCVGSSSESLACNTQTCGNLCDGDYANLPNGVRTINPTPSQSIIVYCDQTTDGGRWTVFQRRQDGSVDFYRTWAEYQDGFGDPAGEFWLGLDALRILTAQRKYELRVDLMKFDGTQGFAQGYAQGYATYSNFTVADSSDNYRLNFDMFTGGNAGNSLSFHNHQQFSTRDADHDQDDVRSCAQASHGAWWYNYCYESNLNGDYKTSSSDPQYDGMEWAAFGGYYYSLKFSEMKIRPM